MIIKLYENTLINSDHIVAIMEDSSYGLVGTYVYLVGETKNVFLPPRLKEKLEQVLMSNNRPVYVDLTI